MHDSNTYGQIRSHRSYTWLYVVVPVVLLFLGTLLIDFNGLYGQDSHTYLRFTKELKTEWFTGTEAASFFWPKGYSAAGATLSLIGLSELWSLRIVSLLALTGSLLLARAIIRFMWNKDGSLFLMLGAATQIYFVRAGFLVMSDILTACLIMAMIYAYLRYLKEPSLRWIIGVFFFATLAFFTRYACVP
ncbi:MAG: glycosyltransferase family 39 protein, partial [Flavobacteriia bacterium]|nr:glycosyltransferase family 39 protein [Flavobacteriia bacterium]